MTTLKRNSGGNLSDVSPDVRRNSRSSFLENGVENTFDFVMSEQWYANSPTTKRQSSLSNHPEYQDSNVLGVLVESAHLEKKRDGVVRAGFAKRYFVLSQKGLHYFRKTTEESNGSITSSFYSTTTASSSTSAGQMGGPLELYGEERGHILLKDIERAVIVAPEDAPYGAVEPELDYFFLSVCTKNRAKNGLFLRTEDKTLAEDWVAAINLACKFGKENSYVLPWSDLAVENYCAKLRGEEEVECESIEESLPPIPRLAVVSISVSNSSTCNELVIGKNIENMEMIELGPLFKEDMAKCMLYLSNGYKLEISYASLLGTSAPPKNTLCVTHTDENYLTTVTVQVKKYKFVEKGGNFDDLNKEVESDLHKKIDAHECEDTEFFSYRTVLAVGFLLCCVFAYFWGPNESEILMKVTVLVGTCLSFLNIGSSIFNQINRRKKKSSKTDSPQPKMQEQKESYSFAFKLMDIAVSTCNNEDENEECDDTDLPNEESSIPINLEDNVPARFIAAEKGDFDKGKERWLATLEWRKEENMDQILTTPHNHFFTIKKYYPQFFHGRSKLNYPVYYEKPGSIDLKAVKQENLSIQDLLWHYMYITEYLWAIIEPSETGRSITVLDIAGIGLRDVGGEVLDFIKMTSKFTGAHFPERSAHIFIVNAPYFFTAVWSLVKPLIDPVTRQKVHVVRGSSYILTELKNHIDESEIPSDYGGSGVALGMSVEEKELADYVKKYQNL